MAANKKKWLAVIAIILFCLAGLYFYLSSTGKTVAVISQKEAEDYKNIQLAAKDAKIKLLEEQAIETTDQIKKLKKKQPEYIATTVVKEVPVVSERERKNNDADFSIITKPGDPEYKFNPNDFVPDDPVILNQYNIKAYKKKIVGITYYPDKYVSVDYSKRVSKSGHYLGVALLQDLADNKSYFGVRYTF